MAFPDDPDVGSLPPSAWAPAPASRPTRQPGRSAPAEAPLTFPNDPAMYRLRRTPRGGAGSVVAVLAALVLFGNLTSHDALDDDPYAYGGPAPEPVAEVWPVQQDVDPAGLAPLDPSLEPEGVASRPTSLRIEVVGTAPSAEAGLTAPRDGTLDEHDAHLQVDLPYAGTLPLDGTETFVRVTASIDAVGDSQVQCRVYDGARLVAEDSTPGLAVCEVDLGR